MRAYSCICVTLAAGTLTLSARGGELTLELKNGGAATFVGAVHRWDADGNHRVPVDPKAKIDAPPVTAKATRGSGGRWVFKNLPEGRYDLVILAGERVRVEGFHYPPVEEFDPFLPGTAKVPDEARDWIVKDIAKSRHYENKVTPLFLGGDAKQVRVLMQLVRDKATSFDGDFGKPVATVRHEVWQYDFRYGAWSKQKRTRVLDRILMGRDDFRRWTWVWEPTLGGIEVGSAAVKVSYEMPDRFDPKTARGWFGE